MSWATTNIPDLHGHVAIVTGANSGIGYHTAMELGRAGATVVLACRNPTKAAAAQAAMEGQVPGGRFEFQPLDVSDLDSVAAFSSAFGHERLDLLVNNAGVMIPPFSKTAQGFELQLGTNHLGHFALTGHLLARLNTTPGARVVNVASNAHRFGKMRWDDLQWEKRYSKWGAYGQSKLANLLFSFELQRRLDGAGHGTTCTVGHPGYAITGLLDHNWLISTFGPLVGQSSAGGALPTLRAATDPDAAGGTYFGPSIMEMRGSPKRVGCSAGARSEADAARLWSVSEQLTGVRYLSEA